VPLFFRSPNMPSPGVASEALTEYVDLYPTLAALAGLTPPADLDGRSLVPILNDPKAPGHEMVLSQFSRPFSASLPKVMGYSLRTETQRYTKWIDFGTKKTLSEELYDYTDPASTTRRAAYLVEVKSQTDNPTYAAAHEKLSNALDQMLATRITAKPGDEAPSGPKQPKKKKKKVSAPE
jgi:arylsulfatase A-like enzyme